MLSNVRSQCRLRRGTFPARFLLLRARVRMGASAARHPLRVRSEAVTRTDQARALLIGVVNAAANGVRLQTTSPLVALAEEWLRGKDEEGESNGDVDRGSTSAREGD